MTPGESLHRALNEWTRRSVEHSGTHYLITVCPDLWSMEMELHRLEPALLAVLKNAVEAMPDRGLILIRVSQVCVKSTPLDLSPVKEGRYLRISVADTGPGISKEVLNRLFEPGFTTKPRPAGLGLAEAASLMSSHGGSIAAKTRIGQGTTVHLYIPAVRTDGVEDNLLTADPDCRCRYESLYEEQAEQYDGLSTQRPDSRRLSCK